MAVCRVKNVRILEGDLAHVTANLCFEIELDVAESLKCDAIFRCVYVADAEGKTGEAEVELDALDVGSDPGLPKGFSKFALDTDPPSRFLLEKGEGPLEVAGLYISGTYRGEEFIRIGYYLRHQYTDEALQQNPPDTIEWSKLQRVLSEPVITNFMVQWDGTLEEQGAKEGLALAAAAYESSAGSVSFPATQIAHINDTPHGMSLSLAMDVAFERIREQSRSPERIRERSRSPIRNVIVA